MDLCPKDEMMNIYMKQLSAFYKMDSSWKSFLKELCAPSYDHHWTSCPEKGATAAAVVF